MALYFVEYDLRKQKNYQPLYDALAKMGAMRMLKSSWCFKGATGNSEAFVNHLRQYIDNDDGVIVSEVVGWASIGLEANPNQLK